LLLVPPHFGHLGNGAVSIGECQKLQQVPVAWSQVRRGLRNGEPRQRQSS